MAHLIDLIAHTPLEQVEQEYQSAWDAWDDRELTVAFERRFATSPDDFQPLRSEDSAG